jgi:hypothetical protein
MELRFALLADYAAVVQDGKFMLAGEFDFRHPLGVQVSIPDGGSGTVKPVYVEMAVDAIDRACQAEEGRQT